VDRNRGSKSNNLPSGAAEYGMISKIIELENALDDAIELNFRRISATKTSKGKRPGSPVLAGRNLESYDPQAHPWTNDIPQKWRKLQAKRAEARMAAANAKLHKHHKKQVYDEQDRLHGRKKPK
jgi:hypothetical protein